MKNVLLYWNTYLMKSDSLKLKEKFLKIYRLTKTKMQPQVVSNSLKETNKEIVIAQILNLIVIPKMKMVQQTSTLIKRKKSKK
jgi:hypothetical protein